MKINSSTSRFLLYFGWFILLMLVYLLGPWYIVQPGYTALQVRLGRLMRANKESGLYFKMPVVDSVIYMNNRISKVLIETTALSKDLQFVSIGVALNYRIEDAIKLYQVVGADFEKIILDPYAHESIKAVVAKYTAEQLIQCRHEAKEKVCSELRDRLRPLFIDLIDVNFSHSDFSKDFIAAVENKQIALQRSLAAENLTKMVNEEATQSKLRSDAEAYSLKIKKETITPELIGLKAIEKWDGKLPTIMSKQILPMLNMHQETKE